MLNFAKKIFRGGIKEAHVSAETSEISLEQQNRLKRLLYMAGCFNMALLAAATYSKDASADIVDIDNDVFMPSSVKHLPGSKTIHLYGASHRNGTNGMSDSSRLTASDNGVSNNWGFSWLNGLGRTGDDEINVLVCQDSPFCENKVFVVNGTTLEVNYGDLASDGLTVANVKTIPNFMAIGSIAIIGDRLISVGFDGIFKQVDINSGNAIDLPGCSWNGYDNNVMGPGIAGGYLYTSSDYQGANGSDDLFRQKFDGTQCINGTRENLNNVPEYGNPNTSNTEVGGAVDPLTGDVYYFYPGIYLPKRAKLAPKCGDGFISGLDEIGGEQCDSTNQWPLNGQNCTTLGQGFTGGTLGCNAVTCQFDTSACTTGTDVCGDGTATGTEECDTNDYKGETCETIYGVGSTGNLACDSQSCAIDSSGCELPPSCGDLSCNGTETCSTCPSDCGACCGNPTIEPGEDCDGTNLNGASCASEVGTGSTGDIACDSQCKFDTSACTPADTCNNGALDSGEDCDGNLFVDSNQCSDILGNGWTGNAVCTNNCQVDTNNCSFNWGISSLLGNCSVSGDGATQTINFEGGDCTAEYWPINSVNPTYLKWSAEAGKAIIVNTMLSGQTTVVDTPQGVDYTEVDDNGNKWALAYGAGVECGPEGTTYSAIQVDWPWVQFSCSEGAINISMNNVDVDFQVDNEPAGRLPADWSVEVNVLSGDHRNLRDLNAGGAGGAAGSAGSAGAAGSAGEAGTGGTGAYDAGTPDAEPTEDAGEPETSTPVNKTASEGDDSSCSFAPLKSPAETAGDTRAMIAALLAAAAVAGARRRK